MQPARISTRKTSNGSTEYWVLCPLDAPVRITPEEPFRAPYWLPADKPVAKCSNLAAAEKICRDFGWESSHG